MAKCKAQDPSRCPYHSRYQLKAYKDSLIYWEGQKNKAFSYENYGNIVEHIALAKARIDANEKGFKSLVKDLNKARRDGDNAKAAELAHRLQQAAEARLKDGVKGEWEESYSNFFTFGSKVLEEAEKTDDVRIPISLSGTQNIMVLYKRLISENLEVVDVEAYQDRENFTKEQKAEFFQTLKAQEKDIYNGKFDDELWDNVFDSGHVYLRGLTFVKDGRTITVRRRSHEDEWAARSII